LYIQLKAIESPRNKVKLCTQKIQMDLEALLAYRLIPLNKNLAIGVCEILRRILGKAIVYHSGSYQEFCWIAPGLCRSSYWLWSCHSRYERYL